MTRAPRLAAGSLPERLRVLARDHWGRSPVVIGPAADVLGRPDELVASLRALGRPRLYVDGAAVTSVGADRCAVEDRSIAAYVERLAHAHTAQQITCIAKDLEVGDERIWFACGRFLTALYDAVGFPAGPASLAMFAGRYGKTPFGCHKDCDDVITYVIEGRKRFLVWPFEVVAQHLGIDPIVRGHSVTLEKLDYNQIRHLATVLEGEPGDLLYWPWDHWHVAESDGELTASLSLGIEHVAAPRALDPEAALYRRTRFGFRSAIEEAAGSTFHADDWLVPALPGLIAWQDHAGALLVSVNGHGFTLDALPGLTGLFADLARGERIRVKTLAERYAGLLDREELDQILDCLLRFRAFTREPAVDKPLSSRLFARSDWFPLHLSEDGATLDLAQVTEAQHRILDGFTARGYRVPVERVLGLYKREQPRGNRPRYIFTAGYCGSTLVSRCIEAIEHCWTINEPRVVDDWAHRNGALAAGERAGWERVLAALAVMLFRTDDPRGKVVVKGGEGATGCMEELFQIGDRPIGLLLYSALPAFLANTLKAETRRAELRRVVRSPQRALVARRIGLPEVDPDALTDAQAIACVWLTDFELYTDLHRRHALRALELDGFLDEPVRGVRALADHFALDLPAGREAAIASSEIFHNHAKRGRGYDKQTRRTTIDALALRHREEIEDGLRWCRDVWGREPEARLAGDLIENAHEENLLHAHG